MDGWIDGWIDGYGGMDGWMDEQLGAAINTGRTVIIAYEDSMM